MNNKTSKNFDQIKPFLRMLEGSIDDARQRRLGHDAPPATSSAASNGATRPGMPTPPTAAQPPSHPIPMQGGPAVSPAALPQEAARPLRATPIKPKQSLHPSTGYRPTGS